MACDPGLSGALAFYDTTADTFAIHDMPLNRLTRNGKAKNELDLYELARIVDAAQPERAFVEKVGSMPGQGVSSMFAFGKSAGAILGIIAANFIPVHEVAPTTWKRGVGIPTGSGKDASRVLISNLYPKQSALFSRVKDNGRADAALIALWGSRQIK
jgi:crossover junction endodeoxyribonuclease RuvC